MKAGRIVLAACLLASAAPIGGAAAQAPDEEDAVSGPPAGPGLYLSGPFGRVAGGSPDEPTTAEPDGTALDAYVRQAPLVLDAGDTGPLLAELVVQATDAPGGVEVLSSGEQRFTGPSTSGQWVVVAEAVMSDGASSQRAWLIDVPDRDPPPDGLYDIPAPDVIVETKATQAVGTPEDGCYLYLCADAGFPTPPSFLETLKVTPGELLSVRLSDGSAMVGFEGSVEPLGKTQGETKRRVGVAPGDPVASIPLMGLEGPASGEWRLTLKVVLDRERGFLESSYRLVSE